MFKKAGIVVGITFILAGVIIYWFVGNVGGDGKGKENDTLKDLGSINEQVEDNRTSLEPIITNNGSVSEPQTEPVVEAPTQTAPTQPIQQTPPVQPVTQDNSNLFDQSGAEQSLTKTIPSSMNVFSDVEASELGDPATKEPRTEIMTVAKKKVTVLDKGYNTNEGKQLVYSVELLSGDKVMDFFLNGVSYESVNVGDLLKVDYHIFKNDNGVEFPVIMSVEFSNQ